MSKKLTTNLAIPQALPGAGFALMRVPDITFG